MSISKEQFVRLYASTDSPHIRTFLVLAVETAGRCEAILDLEWRRVDFNRGIVDLDTEDEAGRKGRATVPMTATLRHQLLLAREGALSDFVVEWKGQKVGSVKRGFQTARRNAGLNHVTIHDLRRSAAIWMAEDGVSMPVIASYLGHSDDKITQRVYARYSPTFLRDAAASVEIPGLFSSIQAKQKAIK